MKCSLDLAMATSWEFVKRLARGALKSLEH